LGFAGNFTEETVAMVATTATTVPTAGRNIPVGSVKDPPNSLKTSPTDLRLGNIGDQEGLALPTPIDSEKLKRWLQGYPQANTLIHQFKHGFNLKASTNQSFHSNNHKSAHQNPEIVTQKLQKELKAGRIAGPFPKPPFEPFMVSPLGLVPKKDGGFRVIHDLSYPKGHSVNDSIHHSDSTVQYAKIDDAIKIIKRMGRCAFMAKTDVESAFRLIPIRPANYHMLGFTWANKYYYDRCLPMGCSSSCNIFTQFSQALQWAAYTKMGINNIVFILDDFLFINSSYQSCHSDLYKFINMCQDIGVPIAHNKTFQPSQVLSFLGIELDALHAEARLPQDKLDKCINSVQAALSKSKLTLRQLQSLIGLLNFACQVVSPGRAFLRRLINLTLGKSNPYHKVRLNVQAKCDLRAWLFFL
jgi:hypothetical protein